VTRRAAGRLTTRLAAGCLAVVAVASAAGCTGGSGGGAAGSPTSGRSGASGPAAPSGSRATASAAADGRWYLSLGDSLAFGFQQRRFTQLLRAGDYRPAAFPGFTRPVARSLALRDHHPVRTVNYGCPGETTATFAAGGCPFRFVGARLHDPYPGAQLAAATTFLDRHRGAVALVTLAIGANDLSGLRRQCGVEAACYRRGVGAVARAAGGRLGDATRRLVAAAGPAPVVVVLPYDPLAVDAPATVPVLAAYNRRLAAAARAAGATVVDALPDVNGHGAKRVCALTLYCGPDRDTHPSDLGYAELARLVIAAVRTAR
jgi:lysophospholipase L1-like esterase